MSEDFIPVMLSAIASHQSDVRGVAFSPDGRDLFTASRDLTAARWSVPDEGPKDDLAQALVFAGHEGFVNFVLYHPSIPFLDNEPGIVTGSNDKHIIIWNPETSFVEAVLDGHGGVVRCGTILANGDIVSGSWDKTCVVWDSKSGRPRAIFTKHENSVLGVAALNARHEVLSCSGDRTIRRWSAIDGAHRANYVHHTDSVQAVAVVDDTRFFSAGNDALIVLWDVDTAMPLRRLEGHDAFVYTLSFNAATNELLSGSEDQTMRLWSNAAGPADATCAQVVQHPTLVWCAAHLPNGDIATGAADGQLRIWTRDFDRIASQDKIDALEAAVAARQMSAKTAAGGAGGVDPSKLPHVAEALATRRGSHEGEKLLARNDAGEVEVYAWNGGRWDKIGTVVGGSDGAGPAGGGARQKSFLNGKPYDYVFNVDFNGSNLQFGYNGGDNVFDAAQNFINDNAHLGVSQMDKEAIEQHILNNISPEDVAKVTGGLTARSPAGVAGGGGGGANTTGSGSSNAFSEYAREAEELRRRGGNGGMSFKEAMAKMEAEGSENVAFSTFAREGQALAANAGGGRGVAVDGSGGGSGENNSSTSTSTSPQRFEGINADAVSTKLQQLLGEAAGGSAFALVHTTATISGSVGLSNVSHADAAACLRSLRELIVDATSPLPRGSRFPAVDLLRAALANYEFARDVAAVEAHPPVLSGAVVPLLCATDADPERLTALRCLANGIQACPALALDALSCSGDSTVNDALFLKLGALVRSSNANVKGAVSAVLFNSALVAVGVLHTAGGTGSDGASAATALASPAFRMALADAILGVAGKALLFESDAACLLRVLEPAQVLAERAAGVCLEFEQHVSKCGRRLMYTALMPRRDVGDARVRAVAQSLCRFFALADQ